MKKLALKVDSSPFTQSRNEIVNGVNIEVSVSPYIIPCGMNASYDEKIKKLLVDLEYLDSGEPMEMATQQNHVTLFTGRRSGRLTRIEIDVDKSDIEMVKIFINEFSQAITKIKNKTKKNQYWQDENLDIAQKVFSEGANRLVSLSK